jgi:Cysteine-rich secretory protein family
MVRFLSMPFLLLASFTIASAQNSFVDTMLQVHNFYRAELKISPLQWDETLAASATEYAQFLAKSYKFEHSKKKGIGENLWQGTTNYFSPSYMVHDWASEKKYFKNLPCPKFSTSGNWWDVGHYTQIIWSTTTKVGCGIASNKKNDILVCHYTEAGNIMGVKAY